MLPALLFAAAAHLAVDADVEDSPAGVDPQAAEAARLGPAISRVTTMQHIKAGSSGRAGARRAGRRWPSSGPSARAATQDRPAALLCSSARQKGLIGRGMAEHSLEHHLHEAGQAASHVRQGAGPAAGMAPPPSPRAIAITPAEPRSGTHGGTLDQSFEETRAGRLPGTKRARKRLTQGSFLFPSAPPLGLDSRRRATQQFLHRICGHFRAIGTQFGKVDQGAA